MTYEDEPAERSAIAGESYVAETSAAGPTAADPLRGLDHLSRVALAGRDTILARAREPVPYVWKDVAVAGTVVLLAGGPAEGKTTLLFLVLVARATIGAPVDLLGRLVTPAPPGQFVVLIEGEHGEASTCRKLVRSCTLAGVDDGALGRFIVVARKAVRLGSVEWLDVCRLVEVGLVSDIAIDTVARVAPGDANDEREQVAIFDIVAQAIEMAPAGMAPTAWACAHTRKPRPQSEYGGLADVSGSAQRTGQADSVLMVKGEKVGGRTVSSTVTFAKLREEPDEYPAPVTFSLGDGALNVMGAAPVDDRPIEARIESALAIGPKTSNALATALCRSKADVEKAISLLFSMQRISSTSIKVNGRDRKAFELRHGAP